MKKLSFDELKEKLQKQFPSLIVKDSKEFYSEPFPEKQSLWLPNAESVSYTAKDHNTLYQAHVCYDKNYNLEVYRKFDKWCNRYGWYASTENYTMQIFNQYESL